ncbi:hypothetical protein PYCCODRAFT_666019 [Trametes coccinea BRFM310]|uniref:Uncharacterized protein n=1 Tax=Trametes coccinea (strain BRFM310) TaxID=1353009 RepID=A0A1Y2II27_TRAC3|nr:hypothetical protein PYCCODRAFT_666019 [Trametes coccinea BRFM310]
MRTSTAWPTTTPAPDPDNDMLPSVIAHIRQDVELLLCRLPQILPRPVTSASEPYPPSPRAHFVVYASNLRSVLTIHLNDHSRAQKPQLHYRADRQMRTRRSRARVVLSLAMRAYWGGVWPNRLPLASATAQITHPSRMPPSALRLFLSGGLSHALTIQIRYPIHALRQPNQLHGCVNDATNV